MTSPDMAQRCIHCGKERGDHQAQTLLCPIGRKTRIGYTTYGFTKWHPQPRGDEGK